MLDLPASPAAPPPHWHLAPLPDAPLCEAHPDRLVHAGGHDPVAASPALLAALGQAGAPEFVFAWDSSGAPWRLRRCAVASARPLWWLQALADSHARLFARLRGLLGRELNGCVLHELRGPLNALSLHADLLGRLLSGDDAAANAPRALNSAEVMRERLRELRQRQDGAVALWLGEPAPGGAELARLVEDSLRLLRGHLSLHEVRLRSEALGSIGGARLPRGAAEAQLALIALLVAACAGARQNRGADGAAEVLLVAGAGAAGLSLEIQAPYDGAALGRELAGTGGDGLLAALALLLEPSGLRLEADGGLGLTRLTLGGEAAP
jgi:hypothetical protein